MGYSYNFILLTFYLFSIQVVFGNYEVSANEESIKVFFPTNHKEKVVGCQIKIFNDDNSYLHIIFYENRYLNQVNNGIQYIGEKDNTCSFIFNPNYELFKRDKAAALRKKWTIIEIFECGGFLSRRHPCQREYNVFFNPQSFVERFTMSGAKTEITRSAPYTNKTLTIRPSSEKQKIYGCRLALHEVDESSVWNRISGKEDYAFSFDIYPSSVENGIEYIGDQDNSCSFRINLDYIDELNHRYNGFLDRYWTIKVLLDNNGDFSIKNYKFYMNSLSWWRWECYVSNVFISKKGWDSIDVQYY